MFHRRFKRAILVFVFLALLVLLLLFSISQFFAGREAERRFLEEKAAIIEPEPNVHTIQIGSQEQIRRFSSEVLPWADTLVPSEVNGVVLTVKIESGDAVQKDQTLVELDPRLAEIELALARARFEENQRLLAEAETLTQRSVGSRTDLAAARARSEISRSEVDLAAERLRRHTIRAPFAGVINLRLVEPGSAVATNQAIAELIDRSRLRVVFFVGENELSSFPVGKSLNLTIPSLPGKKFQPQVRFVAGAADRDNRLFRIEAILEDTVEIPARVQSIVESGVHAYRDLPFIPASAVSIIGRQPTAEVVSTSDGSEEKITRTPLEIGPEIDGQYPVLSGLQAGDRILIR